MHFRFFLCFSCFCKVYIFPLKIHKLIAITFLLKPFNTLSSAPYHLPPQPPPKQICTYVARFSTPLRVMSVEMQQMCSRKN